MRQRGDVMSGGSFESSNDFRAALRPRACHQSGEGGNPLARRSQETVSLPGVDRYFAIEEGKGLVPSVYDLTAPRIVAEKEVHHASRHEQFSEPQEAGSLGKYV